jgi:hypothetical protein
VSDWQEIERRVGLAAFHFGKVASIAAPDDYVTSMALRHAMLCGRRELDAALCVLRRTSDKGAGYSAMTRDLQRAYLTLRALQYEDEAEPSDVDPGLLREAVGAAAVMTGSLQADFERIKKEMES